MINNITKIKHYKFIIHKLSRYYYKKFDNANSDL